jgi:hypothetical protein
MAIKTRVTSTATQSELYGWDVVGSMYGYGDDVTVEETWTKPRHNDHDSVVQLRVDSKGTLSVAVPEYQMCRFSDLVELIDVLRKNGEVG